ncbi:MAG TPA: hypothetical protein VEK07_25625 [Polyangiaceae bacterium]|nr:hypothetical protein [Polyangiaceae bacterium]
MMLVTLAFGAFARLIRTPRTWLALGVWFPLALAIAFFARDQDAAHPADHLLVDVVGAVILPLLVYLLVGAMLGAGSLAASASPYVALGARPAWATLAFVGVGATACCACGAALCGAVAALAHGAGDPPRAHDALVSAYVGGLGGAAYACWFACGAAFGRRGGGRPIALVLDWLLGAQDGTTALFTPRAHVRNLLGGAPPLHFPERASALALVGIVAVSILLSVRRVRPKR